jgi:predicted Zn-dependent protease
MVDEPSGPLSFALERATELLASNPALARRQAEEILRVVPGEPRATLILGAAHRMAGDPGGARHVLAPLALAQPRAARVHYELGQCLAALGEADAAIAALRRATTLKSDMPDAWRALGDQLMLQGDAPGADSMPGTSAPRCTIQC